MVLIQLLLPTSGAASADGPAPLAQTRGELADRFTGVTAYVRSPAKGLWTAPDGQIEQDDVVMVEVVTDALDLAWWRTCRGDASTRGGEVCARAGARAATNSCSGLNASGSSG